MTLSLFDDLGKAGWEEEQLGPGAVVLRGLAATSETALLAGLESVTASARSATR
jgi:hypothetical protein